MERSEVIALTKRVKDWAVSVGVPRSKVHARTSGNKGNDPYIQMHILSEPTANHRDPIVYAAVIPGECRNRMIKIIYPNSAFAETSHSAGNIFSHMMTANASHWVKFLDGERAISLINDFKEWSGGFLPSEVEPEKVETYITHTLPASVSADEFRKLVALQATPV